VVTTLEGKTHEDAVFPGIVLAGEMPFFTNEFCFHASTYEIDEVYMALHSHGCCSVSV
jgi:hypothetical protein